MKEFFKNFSVITLFVIWGFWVYTLLNDGFTIALILIIPACLFSAVPLTMLTIINNKGKKDEENI